MKLQVINTNKKFKAHSGFIGALENINLSAQLGEFICLVGPSGCGKSTLLNLLVGIEKPDAGSIIVDGKIGLMFQEPALFPWLRVRDNIGFGLKIKKVAKKQRINEINRYLQMVHLESFSESYPHELSGGMKQRVALARTLILDPDILLMDEPFAALDAQTREMLYKELQEIWQATKKTIIFVTHNVREAVCLGDRIEIFTARPGTIKKEIKVNLKRPRSMNDLEVAKIANEIMDELKIEIEKAGIK